jgi:hypothetical protein
MPRLTLVAIFAAATLAAASFAFGDDPRPAGDSPEVVAHPTTVTLLGIDEREVGTSITLEELIEESEGVDQSIRQQLESGLDESTPEVREAASFTWGSGSDETAAGGPHGGSSPVTTTASNPSYTVISQWWDSKSIRAAVRRGTSTWGWMHLQKHNVSMAMLQKTTKFPRTRTVTGSTITYVTPAMQFTCWLASCNVDRTMDVKVVLNNTRLRDGAPKGVITAYCMGVSVCPAWVREVAG